MWYDRYSAVLEKKGKGEMDVSIILKIAGVGLLVAVCAQILGKYGRDDQAMLVGISGIVVVLLMLVGEVGDLLSSISEIFGF